MLRFHSLPQKGPERRAFTVASWNLGGLSAANALEMLQTFGGNEVLASVSVVLLQKIITEAGRHFAANKTWTLLYGKTEGEWCGEGVAFCCGVGKHTRTQVMPGGVAIVLVLPSGAKLGLLSAHMPHHATIARAEALMSQWGESRALASREVLLGIDANEISNE